ncbi:F-box protein pof6 [Lasiodiplodia hormozganensis]|uniref:F-box protein pof6 n=1 Tax=Lasiodiplodia hormozganensis TaxID=869390 RepID=A0AA39X1U2_9PEZI|nr:F-box protein pof6 [Lasiodiplodia hormozganensis]
MSSFTRQSVVGASRQDVLSSLRATSISSTKPVLPAELIAAILDYLPVPDMIRFARTSKRMREMVYDDTRWIQRLKSMGCWNDQEARKRFEDAMKRKLEAQRSREAEEALRTGAMINGSVNGLAGGGGTTLFDAGMEEERLRSSHELPLRARRGTMDSGFSPIESSTPGYRDPEFALNVLSNARSARGFARQEYGKIYGALAPYYFDLARSRSHMDPVLFRVYRDPEQQAKMLAQIKVFARSDYAQGYWQREERLDTMMGLFENAALREFEQGYEAQDIDGRMKKYAQVLVTLNGGAAAIDSFIHNHPLMLHKERLGDPLDCLDSGLSADSISLKPSQAFFERLATALNEQASIIDRVFPPSVNVTIPFLERIGEDVVSEYINPLLDEAHERNIESYLKAVSGLFEQALRFEMSLQSTKTSETTFKEDAHRVVARCFEQHIDLYLQDELDYFKDRANSDVEAWEKRLQDQEASTESFFMSNVNRQVAKRDFLTSFKKVIMMPVNVMPFASSKPTDQASMNGETGSIKSQSRSSTPVPIERSSSPRPGSMAPTSELAAKAAIMNSRLEGIKSLFSIEVALNLVHLAKASLERVAKMVPMGGQSGAESKEQCEVIFVALLQILGSGHIKVGFDKAIDHLSKYNPREVSEHDQPGVQPLVTFLELVNVGDLIQQMVDVFYQQELVATQLAESDDFLSQAAKEKKRFEQMLDERVAAGLNKGIDVLMDEVEYLCATTQDPKDFNPGAGTALEAAAQMSDVGPSTTARRIIELVSSHINMLVGSTDKTMLDVFNQEVGVRLFTALCKHIKRQRISIDGAIKLISDMNAYHSYIVTLKNKSLNQYFSALRELTQIYLISANDAKEIATVIADGDRYHGIFRTEEVYEFAERRADWFVVKKDVERAMYGIGCGVISAPAAPPPLLCSPQLPHEPQHGAGTAQSDAPFAERRAPRSAVSKRCQTSVAAEHLRKSSAQLLPGSRAPTLLICRKACSLHPSIHRTPATMPLPPEVEASYTVIIDDILAHSDLNTVSAKRIRKGLQARVDHDITPEKDAITNLILARFDKVNSERNGVAADDAVTGTIEPVPTAAPPATNGSVHNNGSGASTPASSKKRTDPDETANGSDVSDVASTPPKKKHKKSTSVEDDAAFAARLQAEENGRARSTRGGGASRRKAPVKKKGESRKKKSKTKVNSDDDSDLGSGSETKKEPKRNGGFHKPMILSAPLSELLGESQLSRPQCVKKIWEYVKERDLQDPNDKRQIRCDDAMRAVFKQDRVHMFTMNKILNQNLYAIDE